MAALQWPNLPSASRFAPTPTGNLHLGNARTALLAWLAGRSAGLRNVLRIEDLDPRAMPPGCLENQLADLTWLGLTYDEGLLEGGPAGPYRQSQRAGLHLDALNHLNQLGVLYPCWCSRKEVRAAHRAPHASDEGPVYTGTHRPQRPVVWEDLDDLPTELGRRPALRLNVDLALATLGEDAIRFDDAIAGPQRFDLRETMGDFVVRRVDGIVAYQVACAIDDVLMGCRLVLRGSDLLASTARQILILRLLDLEVPQYAHAGLVTDHQGQRLAKRDGAIALRTLRANGVEAAVVRAHLAEISGLPFAGDLPFLAATFDLKRVPAGSVALPAVGPWVGA